MQKEQVVGMAVRLFAVFLVVYILRYAGELIPYLMDSSAYKISGLFVLVTVLVPVLVAIALWLFPLTIASRIIPDIKAIDPEKTIKSGEIESVAFSILGLWVLTSAIPNAFRLAALILLVKNSGLENTELPVNTIANIIAAGIQLVIGFWLLLGSKGVIGVIRRMRYAGR